MGNRQRRHLRSPGGQPPSRHHDRTRGHRRHGKESGRDRTRNAAAEEIAITSCRKIKLAAIVREWRSRLRCAEQSGVSPLPPIYWNHRVGSKIAIDLCGSIVCGQNPDFKELRGRFVGPSWLVPTVTASTMIAELNLGDKVRCHRRLWKT